MEAPLANYLHVNLPLRPQVRGADSGAALGDRGALPEVGGREGRRHQGGVGVRRRRGRERQLEVKLQEPDSEGKKWSRKWSPK